MNNARLACLLLVAAMALSIGTAANAQSGFCDTTDRVRANTTDRWTLFATSGESRLTVRGDGDTDLDCFVYDKKGNLLGSDEDSTDYCIIDFWQSRSGDVRIEIKNLGDVYNEYRLRLR